MNAEQRLNLISKIAQNAHCFTDGDEYWLIGMLSDTTMSDDALLQPNCYHQLLFVSVKTCHL